MPKDFGQKELVWTLKTNGVTEKAYASLKQDYFIDNVVIASETGALGAGSSNPTLRANKAPVVTIDGEKKRTARSDSRCRSSPSSPTTACRRRAIWRRLQPDPAAVASGP